MTRALWMLRGELRRHRLILAALVGTMFVATTLSAFWIGHSYAYEQAGAANLYANRPRQTCADVGYTGESCEAWSDADEEGRRLALAVETKVAGAGAAARTAAGALGFAAGHATGIAGVVAAISLSGLAIGSERAAGVDRLRRSAERPPAVMLRFLSITLILLATVMITGIAVALAASLLPWGSGISAEHRSTAPFVLWRLASLALWLPLVSAVAVTSYFVIRGRARALLVNLGVIGALLAASELPGIGRWTPFGLVRSLGSYRFERAYFDTFLPLDADLITLLTRQGP